MKKTTPLAVLILVASAYALDIPFYIQETTGNTVTGYPVTMAVPLPEGIYRESSGFSVIDQTGTTVPAQISVLNRKWSTGFIRHLLVTLETDLAANQKKTLHLRDIAGTAATGLTLSENDSLVTVTTGPLRFSVRKHNFNLFNEVFLDSDKNGAFDAGERIISPSADNGGIFTGRTGAVQKSSDVANPVVTIEERGPIRAIIKVEAPTLFTSVDNHTHGYSVRLYAYAGKPFVKVEYTLKNSAKNAMYSWPLYAKDFSIKTHLDLGAINLTFGGETSAYSQALGTGAYLFQKLDNAYSVMSGASTVASGAKAPGWIDASDNSHGVTVYVRNFREMWPNGLEMDGNKDLYVRMLPKWESGYYWSGDYSRIPFSQSASGLHWLDDMQHLTKEVLYEFHSGAITAPAAIAQSNLFQKNPVGIVPVSWYASTRVTADLGGLLPSTTPASSPSNTDVDYFADPMSSEFYCFGWPNYMGNPYCDAPNTRIDRHSSCEPGDVSPSSLRFMATENPKYYYQDQATVWGELNVRPEWMGGDFSYAQDSVLDLTSVAYVPAPYCNYSWRSYRDNQTGDIGTFKIVAPYLSGTSHHGWTSRDEQHMWWYHLGEFYFYDGMPLLKDFWRIIGEYQKYRVYTGYFYDRELGNGNTRTYGQALSAMVYAYKITGDESYKRIADIYVQRLKIRQNKAYGTFGESESGLMIGYLARGLIQYMEEQPTTTCKEYQAAFDVLEGLVEWNYNYCNWCYSNSPDTVNSSMSGTAMIMADPQIWYYLHSGKTKYKDHTRKFADAKIYGDLLKWNLSYNSYPVFIGRLTQYAWDNPRADTIPPPAISDLAAQQTQPSGTAKLSVRVDSLPQNKTVYFAVRGFDTLSNMSAISNVYSVNTGSSSTWYLNWTRPGDARYYHACWSLNPIVESSASGDTVNQAKFWNANPIGNSINADVAVTGFRAADQGGYSGITLICKSYGASNILKVVFAENQSTKPCMTVVDMTGRVVRKFNDNEIRGSGAVFTVEWQGKNAQGERIPTGVYFVTVKTRDIKLVKRLGFLYR